MSKTQRRRRAREAKRPIGRMLDRRDLAGRIVNPCNLACFTCDRFLGHNRHACPGVKARDKSDPNELPLCHVDFRTGRMESPLDYRTGELKPGQEKFYNTLHSGPWPAESGCAWVAVKRKNPPAVQGAY
ncbi:MAG: hypothetical protein KAV00_03550 [Phycisphaerae bacterium]|nr:hypothetical protein [Phycisphaerae bacterium]